MPLDGGLSKSAASSFAERGGEHSPIGAGLEGEGLIGLRAYALSGS